MLVGKLVTLRALAEDDIPRLTVFKNDVEVELLGGGDPARPRTLEVVRDFFAERAKDSDSQNFAIEADGRFIGDCGRVQPRPAWWHRRRWASASATATTGAAATAARRAAAAGRLRLPGAELPPSCG